MCEIAEYIQRQTGEVRRRRGLEGVTHVCILGIFQFIYDKQPVRVVGDVVEERRCKSRIQRTAEGRFRRECQIELIQPISETAERCISRIATESLLGRVQNLL